MSRSKRYCRTWLRSHFRALPVYIKRGCAALSFDDAMERIAGAVPVCMLHLIWTCVLDQHNIRCSLSGDVSCNAMTISMTDVVYPSPYDYHLPESLAAACELGHDFHYLTEFDPNTEFLTRKVLRHNLDLSGNDYSSGNHN